ncbi:MAG: energy transducer TonB [Pseudomonadota bacterium]
MSVAGNVLTYREPGAVPSAVLALLVHVLLALFLFFGVRWQSRHADAVEVELWDSLPALAVEKVVVPPAPVPEPAPEIKPVPKPEVKPKPKVEKAVEPPKPDIAVKKEAKKEAKKERPKKPERRLDLDRSKEIRAEANRETAALERDRILNQMRREAAVAVSKAKGEWVDAIIRKIRPNVVAQPDIPGNPEAIFEVTLLPTGDVLALRLRKSSGYRNYDEALERAILKSSPLPKPQTSELFERSLELKFRPQD